MSTAAWKVYGEQTLVCMLAPPEVRAWLRSDLIVGPGEAAVIIKNGKPEDVITEERRKLGNWSDRHLPTLKQWLGIGTDYRALMVSTVPFALHFTAELWTLDRQSISGEGVIRCSVLADDAGRMTNLLGGQAAVATYDILERIKPELTARVFQPAVGSKRHDELRGNTAVLREVEERAREELRQMLNAWGIRLDGITVVWGLTEQERLEIARRAKQLEEEEKEFAHTRRLRELERQAEAARMAQQFAHEERKRAEAGEIEIGGMRLDADIAEGDKRAAQGLRLAEIGAEIAQLDIDIQLAALAVDREKDRMAIERRKEELALIKDKELFDREQDRLDFEMVQSAKRERMRLEEEHELALKRQEQEAKRSEMDMQLQQLAVQLGMIERIMSQGLTAGAVDSAAIQAMLSGQVQMRAVDRGEGVAGAVFSAEAAKHSVEGMKDAEDRERKHQQEMTRLSSDMMQASKQTIPGAVVAGPGIVAPQPSVNVVNVQPPAASQPEAAPPEALCPHCNAPVKKSWKICPHCAKSLAASGKCASCGETLQPNWKACPACGAAVN